VVERPLLPPWYRVAELDHALVLEYGQAVVRLDGAAAKKLVPQLLPLLDGTRSVDELVACLGERIRPAVVHALTLLERHGVLRDGTAEPDGVDTVARLLAASGPQRSESELGRVLAAARVAVAGTGRPAEEAARALRGTGIGTVSSAEWGHAPTADLVVAAPGRDEVVRLAGWNSVALAAKSPWLQILPFDGRFAAVGPLFLPGETCCHACYARRRRANVPYPDEFEAIEAVPAGTATPPALLAVLVGLAALVASRWLATADAALPGRLFAVELRRGPAVESHHVYRVPRCPACAGGSVRPLPWFKETGAAVA
jgi:bacteriocin biosynthesis cyclodehydratase domain-containing protein